jgi:hypothetical protein
MKVWRSRKTKKTCHWCLGLDGIIVELHEEFPHGDPVMRPQSRTRHVATPEGAAHYHRNIGQPIIMTHPPRPYMGVLFGPLRHPHCECWLELFAIPHDEPMPQKLGEVPAPEHHYMSSTVIAEMKTPQYNSLVTFMQAAVHELAQVLRRLRIIGNHPLPGA